MWFSLVLTLLVGATAVTSIDSDQQGAWTTGHEYKYLLRSYTTTALGEPNKPLNNQISGIVISAIITIQVKSLEKLIVNLANVQYAQVQKVLPDGIESIPDDKLSYQKTSLIGENFTIRLKDGVIEELEVDPQTPVWQVNLQKSIASQLQLDTRGKNEIPSEGAQLPTAESPFGLYKVLEQSIGGNCEVQYDIAPLIDQELRNVELLPNPTLVQNNELVIDIKKIKNYQNCKDLKIQSININEGIASKIASRLSTTRTIVSGNLKSYIILSSITTSNIFVSLSESTPLGTVVSKSKITLQEKREIRQPIVSVGEFTRIKDLTYSFKCATDPVTLAERDPNRESVSSSSSEEKTSRENDKKTTVNDRTTSSEENPDLLKGSFINEQLPTKLDELPKIPTLFDCAAKQLTAKQKVNKVRALIQEVIDDFVPCNRDFSDTPSKYLLVVKLMRTLDLEMLKELKQQLQEDNVASTVDIAPKVTALEVFYNALARVGTGPALLLIKQDIKESQLRDSNAARAISKLDTAVRLLTKEYVEAVCDMLEDPKVEEETALKRTVPLVCGKVLGRAARSSSKLISDSDRNELLSRYISVMKQKLRESVKNNDVLQAYALVLGLGNTGDPKILSVLEPYLEGIYVDGSTIHDKKLRDDSSEGRRISETGKTERGTLRSKRHSSSEEKNNKSEEKETIIAMNGNVTVEWIIWKPLRKLMVMMVGEVIRHNPSKYRSVALKLYLNPQESPEIRCIAARSYIMSNPSLIGLMRIAKFVNINSNKEVNSCVRSSLMNAAKEESTNLQSKARTALKFLDPEEFKGIVDNVAEALSDIIEEAISSIIFINKNKALSSAYFRMGPRHLHSDMRMTTTVAYDVSNLNVFTGRIMERIMLSMRQRKPMTNKPMQPQAFTQIMQELKIKRVIKKLDGFVYMEMLKSILYSFDDSTLDEDLKNLKEILLKNNPYTVVDMNVYDRALSFPIETGLPFVFTQEIPSVTLIDTAGQEEHELSTIRIRGKLNVIHSSKLQNTIAVGTPCDHQQYVSGTDNTLVVVAPLTVDIKAKDKDNETHLNVILSPSQKLSATDNVLLYSNTPYTSINNILELKPILLSENTHPMQVPGKLKKNTFDLELFRLTTETDASSPIQDYVDVLYNLPSITNYNIAVQPKRNVGPKPEVTLTVVYSAQNNEDDESLEKDNNPAQEDLETTPKDLPSLDKTPDSKLRRQQFLTRAKSVVKSANLQVVDVSLRIPASGDTLARDYVLTSVLINRLVNNTIQKRICAYFNRQTEDKNIELEVGLIGTRNFKLVRTENLNQAVEEPPEDKYFVNVAWKKQNEEEKKLKLEAIQSQSASLRKAIQNSNAVQQCLKALNTGDTRIQACRESVALANKKDNLKVSVTYNPALAKELRENTTFERAFGYLYVLSPRYINTVNTVYPKYADKNFVEMEVKAPLYAEQMDVTLYTPKADVTLSTPKQSGQTLSRFFIQETPTCSLSKKDLMGFNHNLSRVSLGQCWHLLVSTVPYSAVTIPLVMVKDNDGFALLVSVVTVTGERFHFRVIEGLLVVSLGTRPIASSSKPSYDPAFDRNDVQIFNAYNYLKLVTKDGNLEVVYFGNCVTVHVPQELLDQIVGLCGINANYKRILQSDYRRVQPCHLSSEEYIASFALLSQGCQGPAVLNKQKAVMSLAACSRREAHPIDIINDREAGRDTGRDTTRRLPVANPGVKPRRNSTVSKTEDELTKTSVEYRTLYYENDASMVCFSTVPVPQCLFGCTPEVTEERHYNFHCIPKTSRTMTLMSKIDKGARPDFSEKSVSTSILLTVPTRCSHPGSL